MKNKKRKIKKLIICAAAAVMLASCGEAVGSSSQPRLSSDSLSSAAEETSTVIGTAASETLQTTAAAVTTTTTTTTTAAATSTTTTATSAPAPKEAEITDPYCKSAMIMCAEDKSVVFSFNTDAQVSLASITKLLTACTMLKYLSPEAVVTVGNEIYLAKPESTLAYLIPGTTLSLSELISAMLLPSGNDAAYTAAVTTARAMMPGANLTDYEAVDTFVVLMNGLAEDLGMTNSHFANPEGWDDPGNYTTAEDLMKLVEYAWSLSTVRETVSQYQKTVYYPQGGYSVWTNTNKLLTPGGYFYDADVIGIKTGTTANAGSCLVSAYKRGAKTYFCIVMGCSYDDDRYILTKKLMQEIE